MNSRQKESGRSGICNSFPFPFLFLGRQIVFPEASLQTFLVFHWPDWVKGPYSLQGELGKWYRQEGRGWGWLCISQLTTAAPEAPLMSPPNRPFSGLITPCALSIFENDLICIPFAPLVSLVGLIMVSTRWWLYPVGLNQGAEPLWVLWTVGVTVGLDFTKCKRSWRSKVQKGKLSDQRKSLTSSPKAQAQGTSHNL